MQRKRRGTPPLRLRAAGNDSYYALVIERNARTIRNALRSCADSGFFYKKSVSLIWIMNARVRVGLRCPTRCSAGKKIPQPQPGSPVAPEQRTARLSKKMRLFDVPSQTKLRDILANDDRGYSLCCVSGFCCTSDGD